MCGSTPPIGVSLPSASGCDTGAATQPAQPLGGGGTDAAYASYLSYASNYTAPTKVAATPAAAQGTPFVGQANVNDGSMRNAQLAAQSLATLKAATADLDTPEKAAAAGYHPNPAAPDHWINDQVFATRNGYDLQHPATLMFTGQHLTGVMLSHNPSLGAPPDLGAGAWHTHYSNDEYAMHVWFDKPLEQAFGTETGNI